MFTGIVETRGNISNIHKRPEGLKIEISVEPSFIETVKLGDSVAVDGICLTASGLKPSSFMADVMPRTANLSHLGKLKIGDKVNLERALAVGGRLGGHMVTGHIDGEAKLIAKNWDGIAYKLSFALNAALLKQVVYSGSIALNGVSLTVSELTESYFSVSLIPHTLEMTGLGLVGIGEQVHVETDILGKYVERFLNFKSVSEKGEGKCLSSAALTAFLMD